MRTNKLDTFTNKCNGWITGQFANALEQTSVEVGIKDYKSDETNGRHWHKLATEINIVLEGKCDFIFDDQIYTAIKGDIVIIEQNEPCAFEAITDTRLLVIKTVSDPRDKYAD